MTKTKNSSNILYNSNSLPQPDHSERYARDKQFMLSRSNHNTHVSSSTQTVAKSKANQHNAGMLKVGWWFTGIKCQIVDHRY